MNCKDMNSNIIRKNKKKVTASHHEEQKRKQREAMRRLREARKSNPEIYEAEKGKERERYFKRKKEGKIKSIQDMSEREKRKQRKDWRSRSNLYFERKKQIILEDRLNGDSPEQTSTSEITQENYSSKTNDGRVRHGKIKRRNYIKKLKNEISILKMKLYKANNKKNKYRMRLKRIKKNRTRDSPRDNINSLVESQQVTPEVQKELLFGDVIKKQLYQNYQHLKQSGDKRKFWSFISGNVVKKYRQTKILKKVTTAFVMKRKMNAIKRKLNLDNIRRQITSFLETDECSRLCPGKNEYVKKNKMKKQKRFLNQSLKVLHRKYMVSQNIQISYSTFCRLRPFWVVQPKVEERNTCLCITHTNFMLLMRKLRSVNIIKENTPHELCVSLCCAGDTLKGNCLERTCKDCSNKVIVTSDDWAPVDTLVYEKWVSKRVKVIVKGAEKTCVKTVKEKTVSTKGEVFSILKASVKPFFLHVRNIQHQYSAVSEIKEKLKENEALIHIDFSENYGCKYSEEVQSAHFGGSKSQISLHTVVVYYKGSSEILNKKCFCTVSNNLRHDPVAICLHLNPVFEQLLKDNPQLHKVHFLSDGPTSQYRNRKMVHLMSNYISKRLRVEQLRWHYSEKGHGKGAPDGVGGVLKRTADYMVARGVDIPDLETFVSLLRDNCKGIHIIEVKLEESDIVKIEKYLPENLPPYKGILQCHEIVWTKSIPFVDIRKLTCLDCSESVQCSHFSLGVYQCKRSITSAMRKLQHEEVYSDSSFSEDDDVPLAHLLKKS